MGERRGGETTWEREGEGREDTRFEGRQEARRKGRNGIEGKRRKETQTWRRKETEEEIKHVVGGRRGKRQRWDEEEGGLKKLVKRRIIE